MGGSAFTDGAEGYTEGDIVMDDVECRGWETSIQGCQHTSQHDCTLGEMASVRCIPNAGQ